MGYWLLAGGRIEASDFRTERRYHASLVSPLTASKWRSRLRSGSECCRHKAAIQISLDGIGLPIVFNSPRTALYESVVRSSMSRISKPGKYSASHRS